MIKIYYPHAIGPGIFKIDPRMFFDINGHPYQIDKDCEDLCDIKLELDTTSTTTDKKKLVLDVWHSYEDHINYIKDLLDLEPNTWIISIAFQAEFSHDRFCHIDFMFNRTKSYYAQFPFNLDVQRWYYQSEFAYVDLPLHKSDRKTHIFVAPNQTHNYDDPRKYRSQLVKFLMDYQNLGYLGNADVNPELYLYCHYELPWANTVDELTYQPDIGNWTHLRYSPPHNVYYQDTFISIYGETIEHGNTLVVSEKTYDPLRKGHFVLPFSAPGFIDHLRNLGYRFPDFINYEYDAIKDDDLRFNAYIDETRRLLAVGLAQWKSYWDDNIDILHHNKLLMSEREYDKVDLKKFMQL